MIESEKNMIRELALNGYTDPQIAEIMNYSRVHIGTIRRELGIKAKRGGPRTIPQKTIDKMLKYRRCGLSYQRIGKMLGISRYTVYDIIKREEKQE